MSRRRGSRLFSGHPGLILVSEDIPGITMPAPPADLPPLEDEEPDFDLMSFRQEEDAEEEAESHDGPLRVFLGGEQAPTPVVPEEDEAPVFDVSALAMPAGPDDGFDDDDPLRFMDDGDDFDALGRCFGGVALGYQQPLKAVLRSFDDSFLSAGHWT